MFNSVKIKRVVSVLIFLIMLIVSLAICTNVLEYKEAKKKYTPFFESKTNYDVIFLGTSHMWNHVLPMELWKEYGISSYNWGYSNCTPAENYYLIQDIVKYTSPKVVVIDLYGLVEYEKYNNGKYQSDMIEQQHVQFDSFPIWSTNKMKAAIDVFDDYNNKIDFIWNFIIYHNRWNELGIEDFNYDITTEKGSYFLTGLGTRTFEPISNSETMDIDSVCLPYLLKLIEYCQSKDIQVLSVYIPFAAQEEQQKIANSAGDLLKNYSNCTYINMLDKNILNFDTDICPDNVHLNYSGAYKVTNWIGEFIRERYPLPDYSNDENWINDYECYLEYKKQVIREQETLSSLLIQLQDTDFSASLSIYDLNILQSERLLALMANANIEPFYVDSDLSACAHITITSSDGEIIYDSDFKYEEGEESDVLGIVKI